MKTKPKWQTLAEIAQTLANQTRRIVYVLDGKIQDGPGAVAYFPCL